MRRSATLAAIGALAVLPAGALAHGEEWLAGADIPGELRADVDAPRVSGLRIEVADGRVPALYVRNRTRRTLVVRDVDGRAYLEIGPRGVRADVGSEAFRLSAGESGPPPARAGWRRLSREPQWGWLEYRAHMAGAGATPDFGHAPRTVHRWTTTMTLGARTLRVRGSVHWIPHAAPTAPAQRSAGGGGPWLAAVVLGLAALALWGGARRRGEGAGGAAPAPAP